MSRDTQFWEAGSSEDLSLARRLLRGLDGSWRDFVVLYAPLIDRWCRAAGVPESAVADVGQDVFLTVYRRLEQFDADRPHASFRGWMWTIARTRIVDYFRRCDSQARALGGSTALGRLRQIADPVPLEQPTEAGDVASLLHRALEQVRSSFEERTWRMFWDSTVLGKPSDLVAEQWEVTAAAVRQARSRVLRRLRGRLGE